MMRTLREARAVDEYMALMIAGDQDVLEWGAACFLYVSRATGQAVGGILVQRRKWPIHLTASEAPIMQAIAERAPYCVRGRWSDEGWLKKRELGIIAGSAEDKAFGRLRGRLSSLIESRGGPSGGIRLVSYVQMILSEVE